jgi:peptide/nickel transport system permease protein
LALRRHAGLRPRLPRPTDLGKGGPVDVGLSTQPPQHRGVDDHMRGTRLRQHRQNRVLSYGWPVLVVPLVSVVVAALVGVCGGLLLVARRGRGRRVVQVLDMVLAIPPVLTLIVLGYVLPPGFGALLAIVTVINAPFTARFVRSLADGYFDAGFVEVSLVEGDGRVAIAFREVLPNLGVPLLGDLGNRFVAAMYVVVSAGFLGLAAIGDGADWAAMITDSLGGLALNPAAVIAPATGIGLLAVGVNLLADQWTARR